MLGLKVPSNECDIVGVRLNVRPLKQGEYYYLPFIARDVQGIERVYFELDAGRQDTVEQIKSSRTYRKLEELSENLDEKIDVCHEGIFQDSNGSIYIASFILPILGKREIARIDVDVKYTPIMPQIRRNRG